jgi:hypothetical protein
MRQTLIAAAALLAACGAPRAALAPSPTVSPPATSSSPSPSIAASTIPPAVGSASAGSPPHVSSTSQQPTAPGSIRTDPAAVGAEVERRLWTLDTTTDTSPRAGLVRAADLLTPDLQAQAAALGTDPVPGAEWGTWRSHQATVTPAVTLQRHSGAPPDTPATAYRSYVVALTIKGRDGWSATKTDVGFLTLSYGTAGWAVAKLTA